MTALIVMAYILSYFGLSVGTGWIYDHAVGHGGEECILVGFFWPASWFAAAGIGIAKVFLFCFSSEAKAKRKQEAIKARRRAELDEANHRREVARIEEQTIKMLEEANRA